MKKLEYMLLGEIADEIRSLLTHWNAQNCSQEQASRLNYLRAALEAASQGAILN